MPPAFQPLQQQIFTIASPLAPQNYLSTTCTVSADTPNERRAQIHPHASKTIIQEDWERDRKLYKRHIIFI